MQPHRPDVLPTGPRDLSVPRLSARTSGSSGFLFVNNHVRGYQMPARLGFRIVVNLPQRGSLTIPSHPIDLPADSYFVWPINQDLAGVNLLFATAQPLAILGTKMAPVYAFFAQPGIPAEFVVDDTHGIKPDPSLQLERHGGAFWLTHLNPDPDCRVRFTFPNGRTVTILLLTQQDAESSWKIASDGTTELLLTTQEVSINGDIATLQNLGSDDFSGQLLATGASLRPVDSRVKFRSIRAGLMTGSPTDNPTTLLLEAAQTKPADEVAPLPSGFAPSTRPRVVAAEPTDADWSRAATWTIPLPKPSAAPDEQRFLRIHYSGDVARISTGDHLLTDNFADGRPWLVGLTRFSPELLPNNQLQLSIYPLRANPPIFFEPGYEPKIDGPQAVSLQSVELLTQYTLKLRMETRPPQKPLK